MSHCTMTRGRRAVKPAGAKHGRPAKPLGTSGLPSSRDTAQERANKRPREAGNEQKRYGALLFTNANLQPAAADHGARPRAAAHTARAAPRNPTESGPAQGTRAACGDPG